jgi:hypothetical protein
MPSVSLVHGSIYPGYDIDVRIRVNNGGPQPFRISNVSVRFDWALRQSYLARETFVVIGSGSYSEFSLTQNPRVPDNITSYAYLHATVTLYVSDPSNDVWKKEVQSDFRVLIQVGRLMWPSWKVTAAIVILSAAGAVLSLAMRKYPFLFRERKRPRIITVLFLVSGFLVALVCYSLSVVLPLQDVLSYGMLFYFFTLLFFIGSPLIAILFIRFHQGLSSRFFQKAIDSTDFSLRAIGPTILMLNFTFFTIACLLPLEGVAVTLFPPLRLAQRFIPTLLEVITQNWLNIFILASSFGPSFVFVVRWIRRKNPLRGERLFNYLQILFYASLVLYGFTAVRGNTLSGVLLDFYYAVLFSFVLPGSIGGIGVLRLLEEAIQPETEKKSVSC